MVKLFTHTDLDGVGCSVLLQLAFGKLQDDKVEVEYCNYDDVNDKVKEFIDSDRLQFNDMCFITDISISEELAQEIDAKYDNVYLLDHHPTALELNKFTWCNVKIEDDYTKLKTSGTEMFYNFLTHDGFIDNRIGRIKLFSDIVRDYDTWRWSTIGVNGLVCKRINDLLYIYGREKFIEWCLDSINNRLFPELSETDVLLLDMKQKEIDNYVEKKNNSMLKTVILGRKCGVIFAERFFSELGNRLCIMNPDIAFVAMISTDGTISYRSAKDDIDLGKDIAKVFGGGGHPKAAGSEFCETDFMFSSIENLFGM